jgi:hypothetical protein
MMIMLPRCRDAGHPLHAGLAPLERWIEHAEITPGTALFRRIKSRGGIGGRITARSELAEISSRCAAPGADAGLGVLA